MADLSHTESKLLLEIGETKGLVKSLIAMHESHVTRTNDHDARLRKLETGRARDMGWAAGVGAAVSAGFAVLKGKMGL